MFFLLFFFSFFSLFLSLPLRVSPSHNFIDSQNRELFFHGVNIVYPYLPSTGSFDPLRSFHDEDMQNLESWGFNIIRLGTQWPGLEPSRSQYNATYLAILKEIVEKSSKYRIYSLLDFHQDLLSEQFCGEGIPDWAIKEPDSAWDFPLPLQLSPYILDEHSRPSKEDCGEHDWPSYHFAYRTSAAYQSLYDNRDNIQDAFGEFWQRIAKAFSQSDFVIGYELINEPFAGNVIENPLRLVPGWADRYNLMRMYDKLNAAIREVDEDHLVFFESVTWDDFLSIGFDHVPGGEEFASRSAISYHYYDQVNFDVNWQIDARIRDRDRLNTASMCTEFSICPVNPEELEALEAQLDAFDEKLQSWIGWSYKSFGGITGDCGLIYDENGEINKELVKRLSRTYAQAVAGRTKSMKFENSTKEFTLVYEACEECQGETEIYLNEDANYEDGFELEVSDREKLQWYQPKKNRIHVKSEKLENGEIVKISIRRKNGKNREISENFFLR